jgi:hypothetical protein
VVRLPSAEVGAQACERHRDVNPCDCAS